MANTELIAVLGTVRKAKQAFAALLGKRSIERDERTFLEETCEVLEKIEDYLIFVDLHESVEQMKKYSGQLSGVVADMKKSEERIKRLAGAVEDAARALKVLGDVAAAATKLL